MQVRAVNANGDGTGRQLTGTPELSEKTRATIVAVRGDDGAVAVTWNAPTESPPSRLTTSATSITSADETVDTNWTVEDDAWTEAGRSTASPA